MSGPDPLAFAGMIAATQPDPASYRDVDRYRDFRRVFYGSAEGRRVLAVILSRSRTWDRSYVPGDTHESARIEGMREIGLWIMETMNHEPIDAPETAEPERGPQEG